VRPQTNVAKPIKRASTAGSTDTLIIPNYSSTLKFACEIEFDEHGCSAKRVGMRLGIVVVASVFRHMNTVTRVQDTTRCTCRAAACTVIWASSEMRSRYSWWVLSSTLSSDSASDRSGSESAVSQGFRITTLGARLNDCTVFKLCAE
jgi:hypothetical protein